MNTSSATRSTAGLWFRIFAVAAAAAFLAVPASAQLHVETAAAANSATPATVQKNPVNAVIKTIDMHGWPAQTNDIATLRGATSPAEKKLSFNLILLARKTRKVSPSPVDAMVDPTVLNADGTVNVEIDAFFSPSLMINPVILKVVEANGGSIPVLAYESDRLFVKVRPAQLLDIASNPNVLSIRQINTTNQATNIEPAKPAAH